MAELSAGSGLESAAVRGRGGWGEFVAAVKERLSKRRSAAAAPVQVQEELLLTDALPAVEEAQAPKVLTRENFANATPAEIVSYLKSLRLAPEPGSTIPEAEQRTTLWDVRLSPEGRAAALLIVAEPETVPEEGDLEKVEAAIALLKSEIAPAAVGQTDANGTGENAVEATTVDEEAARLAANVGEFKVLSERFAMVEVERMGLMAVLQAEVELSPEVHALITELLPVMKEKVAGAEEPKEGEKPMPLSFDEAKAQFEALLAELAKVSEARTAQTTEDSSEVREEGAGMTETLELRDVAAETHGENDVTEGGVDAREVLEEIVESGKGVGEITPALAQGELTREDAAGATEAGAGDNHEVIAVAETGDALVVVPEGDGALEDGRTEGEGENA